VLRPIALSYRPELILVSAGFDIHRGDPLADMRVTAAGFAGMTRVLTGIAGECCPGRLVFALEGGYHLAALAGGVSAVLEALLTESGRAGLEAAESSDAATRAAIAGVRAALASHWPIFSRT